MLTQGHRAHGERANAFFSVFSVAPCEKFKQLCTALEHGVYALDSVTSKTIIVTMKPPSRYEIIYAPIVKSHLKALRRQYYTLIRQVIEEQLTFEPLRETRNRKPLKRPAWFGATWELRFGPNNRFRVFYQVDLEKREVFILAIGEKQGNRLLIGGEEIEI